MPTITLDQIMALAPSYDDDFPIHTKSSIKCPDPFAQVLEKLGYFCNWIEYRNGQSCYLFERDPWESEIVIRVGTHNQGFSDYCQSGNIESID